MAAGTGSSHAPQTSHTHTRVEEPGVTNLSIALQPRLQQATITFFTQISRVKRVLEQNSKELLLPENFAYYENVTCKLFFLFFACTFKSLKKVKMKALKNTFRIAFVWPRLEYFFVHIQVSKTVVLSQIRCFAPTENISVQTRYFGIEKQSSQRPEREF